MLLEEGQIYKLNCGAFIKCLCVLGGAFAECELLLNAPKFTFEDLNETYYLKGERFIWNVNGASAPGKETPLDVLGEATLEEVEKAKRIEEYIAYQKRQLETNYGYWAFIATLQAFREVWFMTLESIYSLKKRIWKK